MGVLQPMLLKGVTCIGEGEVEKWEKTREEESATSVYVERRDAEAHQDPSNSGQEHSHRACSGK